MTNDNVEDATERELERLLAGKRPEGMGDLADVLDGLRALAFAPSDDDAQRAGAALAAVASARATAAPAVAPRAKRASRGARAAVAGGVTLVLTALVGGTASAADGAAPGDALYRIDRALEHVGIGAGGTPERLAEATHVSDGGDDENAVALVDEIVADVLTAEQLADIDAALADADAAAEADAAAPAEDAVTEPVAPDAVEVAASASAASPAIAGDPEATADPGVSDEVHSCLRDVLDWVATVDADDRDFAQGLADRYRKLRAAWAHEGRDRDDDDHDRDRVEAPAAPEPSVAPSVEASVEADAPAAGDGATSDDAPTQAEPSAPSEAHGKPEAAGSRDKREGGDREAAVKPETDAEATKPQRDRDKANEHSSWEWKDRDRDRERTWGRDPRGGERGSSWTGSSHANGERWSGRNSWTTGDRGEDRGRSGSDGSRGEGARWSSSR